MAEKLYTVLDADYLDQEQGIKPGVTVTAAPGESPRFLNVIYVADRLLDEAVPLFATQLQEQDA
jgi:hypothetical protein